LQRKEERIILCVHVGWCSIKAAHEYQIAV
jgi:hypothetical protein